MVRTVAALTLAWALVALPVAAAAQNLAEAIEEHRRLALESPTPGVLNDLANLLVLAGDRGEAESTYRRVLSMDAANSEAQFNLGLLLQSRGHLDEAEELYAAVVARLPEHSWAFYQLGAIYESRDMRGEAIEAYARALALDPELYFADVNPQVVTNQLLTEALLEAARLRQSRALAPMQYSRPRQITEMLLSLPPAPDGDDQGEKPER